MAWRPGDALIEFGGRFALGLRAALALAMNVTLPRCRNDPRLSAFEPSV